LWSFGSPGLHPGVSPSLLMKVVVGFSSGVEIEVEKQIPPLRFAPVGMTSSFNEQSSSVLDLSAGSNLVDLINYLQANKTISRRMVL
jgi:hypothetical protein